MKNERLGKAVGLIFWNSSQITEITAIWMWGAGFVLTGILKLILSCST